MKYIDSNIFINAILYDDSKAKRCEKIIKDIIMGKEIAYTSLLSWDEIVYIVKKYMGRELAIGEGKKFLKFPNLIFLGIEENIIFKAQELLSKYNIDPRDAIHAASALINEVKEIISDDQDFDKIKEIKRIKV